MLLDPPGVRTAGGRLETTTFAAPASAEPPLLPPRAEINLGFVDNEMGGHHYVSLPASDRLNVPIATAGAGLAAALLAALGQAGVTLGGP